MSECPRGGWVWLTSQSDETIVMPTTCKTWGCRWCQGKLLALFEMRVQVGVSRLGSCCFMTVTYRAGTGLQRDAESVTKDWKELWRRLRKVHPASIGWKWLRVVEATRRGQPHLHLVVGPLMTRARCYGAEGLDVRRFQRRMAFCDCMAHVVSRVWLGVTGDSYIVDATPVVGARGAGRYLAKYMRKGALNRGVLERLGFKRRWSSSRGWPGSGRVRLRYSVDHEWARIDLTWAFGSSWARERFRKQDPNHRLLERVGDDLAVVLAAKRGREVDKAYVLRRLGNVADVRP